LQTSASAEKFPGRWGNGKKTEKWYYYASSRGGNGKDRKIAKRDRKIALLSLFQLYLCHV